MRPPTNICIIDDDPDAVELFRMGLNLHNVAHRLTVFHDPEKAMQTLDDINDDEALPDLIVLDLNMPRVEGHELLAFMKVNRRLRHIPVLILTVSRAPADSDKSFHLGAVRYINKPWDTEGWQRVANAISEITAEQLNN
jgi:PleD family two-component response regulator